MATILSPILHTVIALALLTAYVVLTALGNDASDVLAILGGQLGGLGVTQIATQATGGK